MNAEITPVTEPTSDESSGPSEEIISEARENGWTDKESFKGKPEQWLDAEAFVEKTKRIAPLLKKNNERLMRELNDTRAQLQEVTKTVQEFGELYGKMSESAYKRAIADVKQQLKSARQDENHDLAEQLEEQLDDLKESSKNIQVPQIKNSGAMEGARIFAEWHEENRWFDKDKDPSLFKATDAIGLRLSKERPDLIGKRAFLDLLKEEVQELFPDKFRKKSTSGMVEGSGQTQSRSSGSGKKSYANLDSEAKAQCDRMTTPGKPGYIPGFTKDQFVEYYFEQQ